MQLRFHSKTMGYLPDYQGHLPHLLGNSKSERKHMALKGYRTLVQRDTKLTSGPLGILRNIYLADCLAQWVQNQDLSEVKRLAFISAKAKRMGHQYVPGGGLAYGFYSAFEVLLSDHEEMIHWYAWHVLPAIHGSKGRLQNYLQPSKAEFHAFNCRLALLGEFDWLDERSDKALMDGVKLKAGKSYRFDFLFFKALVSGDKNAMEENIQALLKGRVAYTRNKESTFGLQNKLVSSWGFMLAKIAYRHGFELDIDSPWLPMEWLPVKPVDNYLSGIEFIDDFDLFTPFYENDRYYSNGIEMSPKGLGTEQVSFRKWIESVQYLYP